MAVQARTVEDTFGAGDADAPKSKAVVIWYSRDNGHGFLKVEGYPDDLYIHAAAVRAAGIAPDSLLKGTALLCNVGEYKGRACAKNLKLPA